MDKDPYEVLGVTKNATLDEIKSKYKKLAMKYHPDRNPNGEERFKEIASAYDLLNNPEKRRNFDSFGFNGPPNFANPFESMFRRTSQTIKTMDVSLEEIYNEKTINISISLKILCMTCLGTGGKYKKSVITCPMCNGKGRKLNLNMIGPGIISSTEEPCMNCNMTGKYIKKGEECLMCNGNKYTEMQRKFEIPLKNTYVNGEQIIYRNKGNINLSTKEKDDLVIKLTIKEHKLYRQMNNDIYTKYKIPLIDALCGFHFLIKFLDDTYIDIEVDDIIKPHTKKIIKNMGMNKSGNLIVEFDILFPSNRLSDTKKFYIRKLLENKNKPKITIPENSRKLGFDNYSEYKEEPAPEQEEMGCAMQ